MATMLRIVCNLLSRTSRATRVPVGGLWRDQQGAALIYVTVMLGAMFGFAALAIDFGRLATTHTQARAAAEAAALAAASQLDGTPDAITRATNAAQATPLVQNRQNLAQNPGNIVISSLRFLSGLPAGTPSLPENRSVLNSYVTTDPLAARFVEVATQTLTQSNMFAQAIGGGLTSTANATAVAGFTQVLCRRTPLAICNPTENPANPPGTPAPPFNIDDWRGRQILIKGSGPSSGWLPGDFALVDINGVQGTMAIWEALADSEPDLCVTARIDLKPGQVQAMRTALNTRFDMYQNPFGGNKKGNTRFRPARSVAKGKVLSDLSNSCSFVNASDVGKQDRSKALTRDTDAVDYNGSSNGTGPDNTHRFGTGVWDCAGYWSAMHSTMTAPGWCTPTTDGTAPGQSRYDMYRAEIDGTGPFSAPSIPNRIGDSPWGENANPTAGSCYSGGSGTLNDTPDRRILYFAVINCIEQGLGGGNSNAAIPVEAFVEGFLTEPVADPSDGPEILIEVKDIVRPGGEDGVLHDIVQLYR
jgi:Flp pilus assembly protein TadG